MYTVRVEKHVWILQLSYLIGQVCQVQLEVLSEPWLEINNFEVVSTYKSGTAKH